MRILFILSLITASISDLFASGHIVAINKTDVWCYGTCTGTSTASVSGGSGSFSYSWSNGATTNSISGLCAGTYSVTVTDNSDLSIASANFVISQPAQLITDLPAFDTICPGVCRTYTANITGGVGPYDYYWVHSGSPQLTTTVCPSTNQTYQFYVTDQNNCTISSDINISIIISNPFPTVTVTGDYVTPCNAPTPLTANGGGPGSTYTWSPSIGLDTTSGPQVLASPPAQVGVVSYTVTVTDKRGCSSDTRYNAHPITPLSISMSVSSTSATCGVPDGSATATATGTHPPFTYTWSTGATGPTLNNAPAGIYTVTAKNYYNCSVTNQINISSVTNTTISPIISLPLCSGASDGSISLTATGSGPFTYSWSTGQTTSSITNLPSGSYTVTVTDNFGCAKIETYTLNNPATLTASINTSQTNCGNNGASSVTASGGNGPYTYSWSNGATTSAISNLSPGTYNVVVTDANNCSTAANTIVNSYCGNVITGTLFDDLNLNCNYNTGENPIPNQVVKVYNSTAAFYGYSNSLGEYNIYVPTGNYSVSIVNPSPGLTVTCPSNNVTTASFSNTGDTMVSSFGFENNQIPDMMISVIPGLARPGFQQNVWVTVKNNGTTAASGIASLEFDPSLQYLNATNNASSTGTTVSWNYSAQPGSQSNYMAVFQVPSSAPLGDTLFYPSNVTAGTDSDLSNNEDNPYTIVTGSFDPNTKSVSPSGNIVRADSLLTYTVQFQNTGTDTAFNIVVIDTLSPFVDPGSIEIMAASHPYSFSLSGQNIATWNFLNILLPDSNTNEPMSHGAFKFSVKVKPFIPVGSVIENFVDIYFDFNTAVRTDTARNVLTSPVSVSENKRSINVFPVPANDHVTFITEDGELKEIRITDVTGKLIIRKTGLRGRSSVIDVSNLSPGSYLYQLRSEAGDSNGMLLISE